MSGRSAKLLVLLSSVGICVGMEGGFNPLKNCEKCIGASNQNCNEHACFGPCGMDADWTQSKCDKCLHDCRFAKCATKCGDAFDKSNRHFNCDACEKTAMAECNYGQCLKPCQSAPLTCKRCAASCSRNKCMSTCFGKRPIPAAATRHSSFRVKKKPKVVAKAAPKTSQKHITDDDDDADDDASKKSVSATPKPAPAPAPAASGGDDDDDKAAAPAAATTPPPAPPAAPAAAPSASGGDDDDDDKAAAPAAAATPPPATPPPAPPPAPGGDDDDDDKAVAPAADVTEVTPPPAPQAVAPAASGGDDDDDDKAAAPAAPAAAARVHTGMHILSKPHAVAVAPKAGGDDDDDD